MRLSLYFHACLIVLVLNGCVVSPERTWNKRLTVEVAPSAQKIKYTGRGAGASFMLMSSMGPMGIAIGTAIDEGIGKEVHAAFAASGENIEPFVTRALINSFIAVCSPASPSSHPVCLSKNTLVNINRLALRAKQGDSDSVWADVELTISNKTFSKSLAAKELNRCNKIDAAFDAVKVDGDLTKHVLSSCIDELVASLVVPSSAQAK